MNFEYEPHISPTADGEIQLEWDSRDMGYVELTINADGTSVFGNRY
jgi:hypothetical protein